MIAASLRRFCPEVVARAYGLTVKHKSIRGVGFIGFRGFRTVKHRSIRGVGFIGFRGFSTVKHKSIRGVYVGPLGSM